MLNALMLFHTTWLDWTFPEHYNQPALSSARCTLLRVSLKSVPATIQKWKSWRAWALILYLFLICINQWYSQPMILASLTQTLKKWHCQNQSVLRSEGFRKIGQLFTFVVRHRLISFSKVGSQIVCMNAGCLDCKQSFSRCRYQIWVAFKSKCGQTVKKKKKKWVQATNKNWASRPALWIQPEKRNLTLNEEAWVYKN